MSGLMPPGPLSYKGQVAVPSINKTFPPATSFNDFSVPTIWTDTANENSYILVSKAQGVANWVLIGGMPGDIATLTGNSGGAVPPLAGNISVTGDNTTGINIVGNPSLGTLTVSGIASSSTQVGTTRFSTNAEAAAHSLSTVALTPSNITSLFSVTPLPVAQGGTSVASFTPYALIAGGTTSTGALQNVSGVGTAGQLLVSNGASALPTWQTQQIVTQSFTSSGTYTPTANMRYCIVECVGGGGGGGGAAGTTLEAAAASGGGGGGYARKVFSSATIGASQTVTVGAGGAGGSAGNNNGTAGTTTTFGSLLTATGGGAGNGSASTPYSIATIGAAGGIGTLGDFNANGGPGGPGFAAYVQNQIASGFSGCGGNSIFGGGALSAVANVNGQSAGTSGTTYGGGGSGGITNNGAASAGGAGASGIIIVTEFIW